MSEDNPLYKQKGEDPNIVWRRHMRKMAIISGVALIALMGILALIVYA
jgi:hypothetical protein